MAFPSSADNLDLPRALDHYARAWPYLLATGASLIALAFFTNPTPDPAMPGATLPEPWRLPFEQPRVHPWPLSYTVGLWILTATTLPSLLLAGYRRFGGSTRRGPALWLVAIPTLAMLAETSYCRFLLPQLEPVTWNSPDFTLICWMYCSSYVPFWINAAQSVVALGAVASLAALLETRWAGWVCLVFGVLAFPIGLAPALAGLHALGD
jgi:hypothetical protein